MKLLAELLSAAAHAAVVQLAGGAGVAMDEDRHQAPRGFVHAINQLIINDINMLWYINHHQSIDHILINQFTSIC